MPGSAARRRILWDEAEHPVLAYVTAPSFEVRFEDIARDFKTQVAADVHTKGHARGLLQTGRH